MQYVQPVGGPANDPYVDANPGAGQEGSPVPAAAIEHPMRELVALITDAGLAPSGASLTQVATAIKTIFQKATAVSAAASGTVDAITANFTPAIAALSDHLLLIVRASGANTSTTPTFTPASATIAAKTIVKGHNQALVAGDFSGAGFRAVLQYDLTLDKWVLQNPATGVSITTVPDATTAVKGKVELATTAEAQALSDPDRAITPSTLNGALQGANQSLAASGYQKLPGGLILQWGTASGTSPSVTFPVAFPSACRSVSINPTNTSTSAPVPYISALSASGFTATFSGTSSTWIWFAIGY